MSFKKLLAIALALLLPVCAHAELNGGANPVQPYINITAPDQLDGVSINPNTAAPGNFTNITASGNTTLNGPAIFNSTISPQGTVFSQLQSGNPLMLYAFKDIPTASVIATGGYSLVSGVSGRTIYPAPGMTVMTSGTGATGTRIIVECASGNILLSAPIAAMVSGIPFAPFSSTLTYAGTAFNRGCAVSDAVLVSMVGGLTTTTDVYVNMPYTLQ